MCSSCVCSGRAVWSPAAHLWRAVPTMPGFRLCSLWPGGSLGEVNTEIWEKVLHWNWFGRQMLPQELWLVKLHVRMLWLLNCLEGTTFKLSYLAHSATHGCYKVTLMVADVQREPVKLLWSEQSSVPAHTHTYLPVIPTVSSCSFELGILVCSPILTRVQWLAWILKEVLFPYSATVRLTVECWGL